ncbi:NAD(P)H-dependent glycerol-3-phosphate dehydrogenase [Gloeocapsa sp. PCC 73106]|uniref:NAD(P)H-dependent glycerol-3-phosphate dehydrogenase n=1 Tax=Gloeocapsa sp. PCC 73106 TaxID=102232 RepID=UPI00054F38D7|nr:NAD(P)H-dependent glycerol-3-phosphate dehydrogenase [Gloeocapsa sp. PCC 73106]
MNPAKSKNITIIGGGLWGTTLANLALINNHRVSLWSRRSHHSLESSLNQSEVIISAVAIAGVRPVIEQLKNIVIPNSVVIVTATKGLDPLTTYTPSQIWQTAFPEKVIAVLSGPNLSKEIAQGLPAATVVACQQLEAATMVQGIFASENFRVYINNDPQGTELGGTLKNVMAIAAGVCDGLQLGTNAKAALLTRALPEMMRVGACLGAQSETFFGLSGLGDLLATCASPLSRNYQVGYKLALGKPLKQIMNEVEGTAEGVNTTEVLVVLANQYQINLPITRQVYLLLQGKITPTQAVQALMERELKSEYD